MEREVGGGIGMGNTCKPIAVSFQCMTKSTTIKKIIISKKKKKKEEAELRVVLWCTDGPTSKNMQAVEDKKVCGTNRRLLEHVVRDQ